MIQILFHYRLLIQDTEYHSLCYTVGPYHLFYYGIFMQRLIMTTHQPIHSSIHPDIYPSNSSFHSSSHLPTHPSIHSSTYYPLTSTSIHLFIHPSTTQLSDVSPFSGPAPWLLSCCSPRVYSLFPTQPSLGTSLASLLPLAP